jgi:two-component system, LuxR family, response regulator FixJ
MPQRHGKEPATIILIDDDRAVLQALAFALEVEGFGVQCFSSGTAALNNHEFPENACLVVDYHMPGMNGLDVIESMRARGIAFPAILITGHAPHGVRERAAADGVSIVEKPFLANELTKTLRRALAEGLPNA